MQKCANAAVASADGEGGDAVRRRTTLVEKRAGRWDRWGTTERRPIDNQAPFLGLTSFAWESVISLFVKMTQGREAANRQRELARRRCRASSGRGERAGPLRHDTARGVLVTAPPLTAAPSANRRVCAAPPPLPSASSAKEEERRVLSIKQELLAARVPGRPVAGVCSPRPGRGRCLSTGRHARRSRAQRKR
ncbi:unnamed protein product [Lampetra planeri]